MPVSTDGVLLGAWAELTTASYILDIGSGSGLLSLMAAQRTDTCCTITAVELDQAAAEQSQANIAASPWPNKIQVVNQTIQAFSQRNQQRFDHIICNPPFFSSGPKTQQQSRANARHTDSLSFVQLTQAMASLLKPAGTISVILPIEALSQFQQAVSLTTLSIMTQVNVSSVEGKPTRRVLLAITSKQSDATNEAMITPQTMFIQNKQGEYSEAMVNICRDFYLKL